MDILELKLSGKLPSRLAVGQGRLQLLQGRIDPGTATVTELTFDKPLKPSARIELLARHDSRELEFFISIPWLPEDCGRSHHIELVVHTREQESTIFKLGQVELVETESPTRVASPHTLDEAPLVAICMASYNPSLAKLSRQIESIRCQSYTNWLLIICDDHSDDVNWREIQALCDQDPRRIRIYRHQQNLGFYKNFERSLSYIPENAALIGLADQDDEWYPEKLQRLVDSLQQQPEATLAYSDMRIVDESGKVLSTTYWKNRRNEYKDFSSLLIRNTVTGAASLFRRELLEVILPFPEPVGESFHDHWIACTALLSGELVYVPEPLYDYIQYTDSIIGHCDTDPGSLFSRLSKQVSAATDGKETQDKWLRVYCRDCLRLQSITDTLKLRIPGKSDHPAFKLMDGGYASMFRLFIHYLGGQIAGRTSGAAELGLIRGFWAKQQSSYSSH